MPNSASVGRTSGSGSTVHNVVLAHNGGCEVILTGCGLGFQAKPGQGAAHVRARGRTRPVEESAGKLREAIRGSYPEAYSTARKLQAVLELRLGEPLTEDEVTYLTLHVAHMVEEDRL